MAGAIAGAANGSPGFLSGAAAGDPFADGYVICTPNGLVRIAPPQVAATTENGDEQPGDGLAQPVCPDCVLSAAAPAPDAALKAAFGGSLTLVRRVAPETPRRPSLPHPAYDSRAPPV